MCICVVPNVHIVPILCRPVEKQIFRIRIHHKGQLVHHPVKWYVGETVSEMDWDWDVDLMSYMHIESMIKNEGYGNISCLWYWNPKFSFARGLRSLNNDQYVLNFTGDVKGFQVIDVYVEHAVDMSEYFR